MSVSRLPFILSDLEKAIRAVAPQVGVITIGLPAGTFGPIVLELANHVGEPLSNGADYYRVGNIAIKRMADT